MAKKKRTRTSDDDGVGLQTDTETMPTPLKTKLLHLAHQQQIELQRDHTHNKHHAAPNAQPADSEDDESTHAASDDEQELLGAPEFYDDGGNDFELSQNDERALSLFMGGAAPRTLADMIMEKLAQRDEAAAAAADPASSSAGAPMPLLPQKVLEVYRGVGQLLKSYRSGKLPKAFKIVPRLANWEEVLYVTNPDAWSPVATREATRLFASNMNAKMAQRFFNLVLLPAVQDDIRANGRLNFHLYFALKKALYKPAAFFKGVLLPLGDGGATLREAIIVCSVLAKVSIPMLHSAVAILKLAEMRYCGANALFLRTLLLKKYALPYRVVDELVRYFLSFIDAADVPTLLWQQCLLAFAQHYKTEVTAEQREALKRLLRAQPHPAVTPEIRRELLTAPRDRGDPFVPHLAGADASDALMVDA